MIIQDYCTFKFNKKAFNDEGLFVCRFFATEQNDIW